MRGDERAFSVILQVKPVHASYHAHIHDVSCTEYRGMTDFSTRLATIAEGLSDAVGGKSETVVTAPLSKYGRAGFSLNVHEYKAPYPVVACGDISAR